MPTRFIRWMLFVSSYFPLTLISWIFLIVQQPIWAWSILGIGTRHKSQHFTFKVMSYSLRIEESTYSKVRIILNSCQALIHSLVHVNLYPLPGMTHKREMKAIVTSILHTGKLRLETRRNGVRAWTTIFGTEVESTVVPLPIDVYDIIESWLLRRWLDVIGLQNIVNEFIGPCRYFRLQTLRNLWV